jgi:predicted DCC family thiol-disulfide oxidoreductase YuxK
MSTPIMLYDGDCALCNRAVHFVIDHERSSQICFAALQSDLGRSYLRRFGLSEEDCDTFVLVQGEQVATRFDAVCRVNELMGGPWKVLARCLRWVPRFLGDALYGLVVQNRFRWFGRAEHCRLPDEKVAHRFIGHSDES